MKISFYDLLIEWTKKPWDDLLALDVMEQILTPFNERKLNFKAIEPIRKLIDAFFDGIGLIMTDEEKYADLLNLLEDEAVKQTAEALMLDVKDGPDVKVTVLTIDMFIQEHPQWFEKPSEMDDMFSDVIDSYKGRK